MTEPLLNFAPVKIEGGRSFYPNTIFKRQGNNYQDRVTPNLKILLRSSSSILSLQRQTSTRRGVREWRERRRPPLFLLQPSVISARDNLPQFAQFDRSSSTIHPFPPRCEIIFSNFSRARILRYVFVRAYSCRVIPLSPEFHRRKNGGGGEKERGREREREKNAGSVHQFQVYAKECQRRWGAR